MTLQKIYQDPYKKKFFLYIIKMLFRNSYISLAAAVILALGSECYTTSSLFFAMGVIQRMAENDEDYWERRRIQNEEAIRRYKEEEEEEEED